MKSIYLDIIDAGGIELYTKLVMRENREYLDEPYCRIQLYTRMLKIWTDYEIEKMIDLRDNYGFTYREIGLIMGRNGCGIADKYNSLMPVAI